MKDKTCSICKKKFDTGYRLYAKRYEHKYSKLFKKWYVKGKLIKLDICDKCYNTDMAIIRNHLAIKTSDIIDG